MSTSTYDPTGADLLSTQPIFNAAYTGDMEALQEILNTNPNALTDRDSKGYQAIHYAARNGQGDVIKFLVSQGVPIDTESDDKHRAVHLAAAFGKVALLELLKTLGADLDAKTKIGSQAIHFAAEGWTMRSSRVACISRSIS
jgi:ankyrin repeat protein